MSWPAVAAGFAVALLMWRFSAIALTAISPVAGLDESLRVLRRWRDAIAAAGAPAEGDRSATRRRRAAAVLACCAAAGWFLAGPPGILVGVLAGPPLLRRFAAHRHRRRRMAIDAAAPELALSLASALSAGRSLQSALLTTGGSIPPPLDDEMRLVVVDLSLGEPVDGALAALRLRTSSHRIELLAGAIALQRRSGGDLAALLRELAESFREADRAVDDARAATAQARFTAAIVAVAPVAAAVLIELARPGLVSGTLAFPPGALLMSAATALHVLGCVAIRRLGRA